MSKKLAKASQSSAPSAFVAPRPKSAKAPQNSAPSAFFFAPPPMLSTLSRHAWITFFDHFTVAQRQQAFLTVYDCLSRHTRNHLRMLLIAQGSKEKLDSLDEEALITLIKTAFAPSTAQAALQLLEDVGFRSPSVAGFFAFCTEFADTLDSLPTSVRPIDKTAIKRFTSALRKTAPLFADRLVDGAFSDWQSFLVHVLQEANAYGDLLFVQPATDGSSQQSSSSSRRRRRRRNRSNDQQESFDESQSSDASSHSDADNVDDSQSLSDASSSSDAESVAEPQSDPVQSNAIRCFDTLPSPIIEVSSFTESGPPKPAEFTAPTSCSKFVPISAQLISEVLPAPKASSLQDFAESDSAEPKSTCLKSSLDPSICPVTSQSSQEIMAQPMLSVELQSHVTTQALLDSGSQVSLIDRRTLQSLPSGSYKIRKVKPRTMQVANGTFADSLTNEVDLQITFQIGSTVTSILTSLYVVDNLSVPLILSHSWLVSHGLYSVLASGLILQNQLPITSGFSPPYHTVKDFSRPTTYAPPTT